MGNDIYVPDVLDFKETDEEGGDQSGSGPSGNYCFYFIILIYLYSFQFHQY